MSRTACLVSCVVTVLVPLAGCGEGGRSMTSKESPAWVERVTGPRRGEDGPPPLLVMLHGIGADESDLFPIAHMLDPRFKVVSLRAPRSYYVGYAWFHIDFHADGTLTPHVTEAQQTLADLIRWMRAVPARQGTDPSQTFLLGFSQGAMMSLGVLRSAPDVLAGVVVLSGHPPDRLFEVRAAPEAIARVPLLVVHGTLDEVLPIEGGRRIRTAFETLSRDFTYREYPIGHGVSAEEIAFVNEWLGAHLGPGGEIGQDGR